jgi:hypothetical protein
MRITIAFFTVALLPCVAAGAESSELEKKLDLQLPEYTTSGRTLVDSLTRLGE